MNEGLENIEIIKNNIKKSNFKENKKNNLVNSLLELETNMMTLNDLDKEYFKSHITFDTYITRKKMLISEQIKLKYHIQSDITKDIEKKIEAKEKGIIDNLKSTIDENANWITILLTISQIILSLSK